MPFLRGTRSVLTAARRAAAPSAPALAPLGSQIVFYGDGTVSEGAATNARNGPFWTRLLLKGRVLPSPRWLQCKSGDNMDDIYNRRAPAIAQKADIAVFETQGHNDGLKNTDPDTDPTQLNKWKRNLDAWIAGHPDALMIPVRGTIPSEVSGETTASSFNAAISRRQRVWDLQQAYVEGKGDARIFYVSSATYDPTVHSAGPTGDAGRVHPNTLGGILLGQLMSAAIDTRLEPATADEIAELLRLGTYPGLGATNIDTEGALLGTGGTKSGTIAPTGSVSTGKRLTNNLTNGTGVGVTASKGTANTPTWESDIAQIVGTSGAENTIVYDDPSAFAVTGGTKGQYALAAQRVNIDNGAGGAAPGLHNFGLSAGNFGADGGFITLGAAGGINIAVDTVMMAAPTALFGSGTMTINPQLGCRFSASVDLTGARIERSRQAVRFVSTPSQSAAAYVGGDTISITNAQLRATGTITDAAGGTLVLETGCWAPYGVTFGAKRVYKGGGSGGTEGQSNLGAGTLLYTIAAGNTWSQAIAADDVTVGDQLFIEIDAASSVGSTYTARSNTAVAVT